MSELAPFTTRSLARELASRVPVLGGLVPRRVRPAPSHFEPFATFERDGRAPVELWAGYRDAIKDRWRLHFWSTRLLLELAGRVELPARAAGLAAELRAARTLPAPLEEFEDAAREAAERFPEQVQETARGLATRPAPGELRGTARWYARAAARIVATARARGVEPATAVELGCGSGYLTHALAKAGVAEAIGFDRDLGYVDEPRRELFRRELGLPAGSRVRLEEADAGALPLGDGAVDLVVSASAIEHFEDLPRVLGETARVLRRGGLAHHGFDPWFSPAGGHSLCTTDLPWGHVRLTQPELERYLRQLRPHEAEAALDFYRAGFQRPRRTLAGVADAMVAAGFELVDWRESTAYEDHLGWVDEALLADCRAVEPQVTVRDLVTSGCTVLLRRR